MMLMVRKAGMALVMLFQSIWAALIIIKDPVRISAGPVQYTGMEAAWQQNVLSPHIGLDGTCQQCHNYIGRRHRKEAEILSGWMEVPTRGYEMEGGRDRAQSHGKLLTSVRLPSQAGAAHVKSRKVSCVRDAGRCTEDSLRTAQAMHGELQGRSTVAHQ